MDQRRALVVRDAAHRAQHLIRAVFQVAQVVPAGGIAWEARSILHLLEQQRLGHHVRRLADLGHHRMVDVPDSGDGVQRRRALGRQLGRAAQVDHGGQADVVHQAADVRGR
jgi:hypothetical protein